MKVVKHETLNYIRGARVKVIRGIFVNGSITGTIDSVTPCTAACSCNDEWNMKIGCPGLMEVTFDDGYKSSGCWGFKRSSSLELI